MLIVVRSINITQGSNKPAFYSAPNNNILSEEKNNHSKPQFRMLSSIYRRNYGILAGSFDYTEVNIFSICLKSKYS